MHPDGGGRSVQLGCRQLFLVGRQIEIEVLGLLADRSQLLSAAVVPGKYLVAAGGAGGVHHHAVVGCAEVHTPQPGVELNVLAQGFGSPENFPLTGSKTWVTSEFSR